jgi:peroxiredoxin
MAAYEKASNEPGFETKGAELEEMYGNTVRLQRRTNIEFIINNLSSLASIKAIYQRLDDETYVLYEPRDIHYMKLASDTLRKYHPNSRQFMALIRDFDNELARFNTNQITAMAEQIESIELNPALTNTEGRTIALQSLRGRYVLLTFWSALSQASVQENIELKQLYSHYNRRGFEIFQINLDADEELWKSTVRFEELPWINVREDDPANPIIAQFFNVRELPSNVLFDREGNIIGRNLHGRNLRIRLEQLFGN